MKTTYYTQWGSDRISVTANWAEASSQVEGDICGYQVADFRHEGWTALRKALEVAAGEEGLDLDDPETEKIIDDAMEWAEEVDEVDEEDEEGENQDQEEDEEEKDEEEEEE